MFIAVEGIDGSGKTTLTRLIGDRLSKGGHKVHLTREPTERFRMSDDESTRHDVQTAIELFFRFTEDRFHHQASIRENLEIGNIVLTDRYIASSLAYQGVLIEPVFGSPQETVEWMLQVSRIIEVLPDITIYLDIEPETALKRIGNRGKYSGFENAAYLSKVREYYRIVLDRNTLFLDSTGDMEEVAENALEYIVKKLC